MNETERIIIDAIDARRDEIIEFGEDIFNHAEMGFCEFRTAEKLTEKLKALGLSCETGIAITGVKSPLSNEKKQGPTVCIMAELDALPIPNSKYANPETGAAHACAHNAQLAAMYGAAIALTQPGVADELCGNVVFIGVPCEESIPAAKRNAMHEAGEIVFEGGKCEMIRLGALDDIDIVVMHHNTEAGVAVANEATSATLSKYVRFTGKSAHAAGAPDKGVDALSAAAVGMHALALHREAFRYDDHVSIHGCFVKGGSAANIIAGETELDYMIRSSSLSGLEDASKRFDMAFKAGAVATGCGVEIITRSGYLPQNTLTELSALDDAIDAARGDYPRVENDLCPRYVSDYCSDLGDVCNILPVMHFNTGGVSGSFHGIDFYISDPEAAYVQAAKIFALTAYNLLKDGAAEANKVMDSYIPTFTKEEYLEYKRSLTSEVKIEGKGITG